MFERWHSRRNESLIVQRLKQRERRNNVASKNVVKNLKQLYESRKRTSLDIDLVQGYDVLINDGSVVNPFIASSGLVRIARREVKQQYSLEGKAKSLYEWVEKNINYKMKPNTYRNAKETLDERKGICGEMAYLYITMARSCGLRSAYVTVQVDCNEDDVNHGCAMVDTGKRDVLVDPAYHSFDVKHKEYQVRTDAEVLQMFNQWRHG